MMARTDTSSWERTKVNEAVTVKKGKEPALTLSTGVWARLVGVSQSYIQDALAMLKEPPVPMWTHPEKEREEPNPSDPEYLRDMEEYSQKRLRVIFDTLSLFGIELTDGVPEDDAWLRRLKLHAKRGHLDLSDLDLDDEIDREFLYKRYVALGNEDFLMIGQLSGIDPVEVAEAAKSFQGDEARDAD